MNIFLKSFLGWLRIMGFLEGMSFLILLFIAMPFKYLLGQSELVRQVGMAHGVLFLVYCFLVLATGFKLKWSVFKIGLALFASLIPFGTFWAEYQLFRKA